MEISQLQSLIKRQGNDIAFLESQIDLYFRCANHERVCEDYEGARESAQGAHKLKRKLKKLVELQKALKKEIAFEIDCAYNKDTEDWLFYQVFPD